MLKIYADYMDGQATATARRGAGRGAQQLGGCPAGDGRGPGLVPDPAMEAFAERPAAGTAEQPPVVGVPVIVQVIAQEADKLPARSGSS